MAKTHLHEVVDNLSLTYHLENTPCGIILWDNCLRVIYCSHRAAEIFDWRNDTCDYPFDFSKLVYQKAAERVGTLFSEITDGGQLHNAFDNRNYTSAGRLVYCRWYNSALKDEDGRLVNILSLVQDITGQKQMEADLEKSRRQLSLIYNSAIDPMWLIAVEGVDRYRFETINLAFTDVTGLTKENVIGRPIEKVMPAASHALVRGKYNEAVRTGKIIDYVEEAVHPAGIKYGEIRVIPIRDEHGQVTKLVCIANDITDKVLLQQKLDKERDSRSRQITKAAIKGQEVERAKVSRELHDNVNQVLTTVKLYIELCMSGKVDTSEILPKCAELLNDSITEIRGLSKELSVPSLGDVGLKETLTDLVETVGVAGSLDISLEYGLTCQVDEELHLSIYRIAQEQLTNILKHANARHVVISLQEKDSLLFLQMKDDGKGFDPGQRMSGIGITNMKSRAQMLNGWLEIESEVGQGTRLVAWFPVDVTEGRCSSAQAAEQPFLI